MNGSAVVGIIFVVLILWGMGSCANSMSKMFEENYQMELKCEKQSWNPTQCKIDGWYDLERKRNQELYGY